MTSLEEVEAALRPYTGVSHQTTGKHITLGRTERLMAHIDNPEKSLRVVHIAGTSGKTSTTYYISALLTAAGCKVGSTISPYVDTMNERIQINGEPLPEKQFAEYFGEFAELLADVQEVPSRFEVLIAFAYWVFSREKVDYAVVETGMGGLDDSTNVAARTDKLCVITDIGYDHMEFLGDTLEKIAYQKAGIIHEGNTALMYDQDPSVMRVVRYWVSQQEDAELLTFEQARLAQAYGGPFSAGMPGFQKRNWLLAYAVYKYLVKRDEIVDISATQLQKIQSLQVPGRMDAHSVDGKLVIMDGAHNVQKMTAFWESFAAQYPGVKPTVLLALKRGKEINGLVPLLQTYAGEVIVTAYTKTQDLPISATPPGEIAGVLKASGIKCRSVPDAEAAYRLLLATLRPADKHPLPASGSVLDANDGVGVITGSFFLIAELRSKHPELR